MEASPEFVIRRFEQKDLGSIMEINRTCLPENYSASFFLDIHMKCPEGFLVALKGDQVVGYIMCRLERSFSEISRFRLAKKGHIVSIAVLPEHRRKGLATRLVSEATKGLIDREAEECFLEVRISNRPAQELYKRLGFQESRRIPFYYHNGEGATVMSKALK